jgi:hypothetical protein
VYVGEFKDGEMSGSGRRQYCDGGRHHILKSQHYRDITFKVPLDTNFFRIFAQRRQLPGRVAGRPQARTRKAINNKKEYKINKQ